jgi:hypothetical protein
VSDEGRSVTAPGDGLPPNPFRGTDLWRLVKGQDLLHDIIDKVLPDATPVWMMSADLLPGVTKAWGLPVRRIEGVDQAYLAFEIVAPEEYLQRLPGAS